MTVTEPALGLRERKRLATRRAIQIAVFDLVSEHGLDGATIDEISRVADVSPRTFFNYFSSKEEVLLGDDPRLPSPEIIEGFITGGESLFDGLTHVLIGSNEISMDDVELHLRRHSVLREHPQLFAMRIATMRHFELEVADVVARRLVHDDPSLAQHPDIVTDRARLVTLVAFAAMRHSWASWTAGESSSELSGLLSKSFADLKHIFASDRA